MILFFPLLFYLLTQRHEWFLWFLLPLSIFIDLLKMTKLGVAGIEILAIVIIARIVFGTRTGTSHRLKL